MDEVAQFMEQFAVPFVCGGKMQIEAPISLDDCYAFADAIPQVVLHTEAIDDAREQVARELVFTAPRFVFAKADMHLLCAVYNLLTSLHPKASSFGVTESQRKRVLRSAAQMCHIRSTWRRDTAIARYALLHNLFHTFRTDTHLSWWTGSKEFYGQEPPARLSQFPALRRVQKKENHIPANQLFAGAAQRSVLHAIVHQVPLLALFEHGHAQVDWNRAAPTLHDKELARAVVASVFANAPRGMAWNPVAVAAYSYGLLEMLSGSPKRAQVELVVSFLVYLAGAITKDEVRRGLGSAPIRWEQVSNQDAAGTDSVTTFFALPNAMQTMDSELAIPPGVQQDPRLRARWNMHRNHIDKNAPTAIEFWRTMMAPYFTSQAEAAAVPTG